MIPSSDHTIIVAEHHPLFRAECTRILKEEFSEYLVLETNTVADALRAAKQNPTAKLVILGLSVTDTHNFSGVKEFRQRFPDTPIAVMSAKHDPAVVKQAIDTGACGFIEKTLRKDQFKKAILYLLKGRKWVPQQTNELQNTTRHPVHRNNIFDYGLTPTELEVFKGVNRGLFNKHIAFELGMAESTVKYHVGKIIKKFGVHSRTQVVVVASKFVEFEQAPNSQSGIQK